MRYEYLAERPSVEPGNHIDHLRKDYNIMPEEDAIISVRERLIEEQGEHFIEYISQLRSISENNFLILPADSNYYYDTYDLSETDAIINLKHLNNLKRIDLFLKSIYSVLPEGGKFIGCFIDSVKSDGPLMGINYSGNREISQKDYIENGIVSSNPVLNRIINFMDARVNRKLTVNIVRNLLKEHGFIIDNITEIHGITYFNSWKYIS